MRLRGSFTVFSALSMLLIASFLFALLEAARVKGLGAYTVLTSKAGIESVCAEYQSELWDCYHLLGLDTARGNNSFSMNGISDTLSERVSENLQTQRGLHSQMNLFQLKFVQADYIEYQLASDGEGDVFLGQVASYMKHHLPEEMAKKIYENYRKGREVAESEGAEYSVEDADEAIREAKRAKEEANKKASEADGAASPEKVPDFPAGPATQESQQANPLETVLELKKNALLGMVVGDTSSISDKSTDLSGVMLQRKVQTGVKQKLKGATWYDKVLALEYINQYFSNYMAPTEEHTLSYEMEYILCGKSTDKDNLDAVISRLLLLREVANVTHIISDRNKCNEALLIANALAGFSGNPAVIKVVQIGIVAAWAYVESILDIRTLLSGGKMAVIKSGGQWTTELKHLGEALQNHARAIECTNGLKYDGYVKQCLFALDNKILAYRMMDIIELNIRKMSKNSAFRMDYVLCEMSYELEYEATPLFSELSIIGHNKIPKIRFSRTEEFSYLR